MAQSRSLNYISPADAHALAIIAQRPQENRDLVANLSDAARHLGVALLDKASKPWVVVAGAAYVAGKRKAAKRKVLQRKSAPKLSALKKTSHRRIHGKKLTRAA